MENYSTLVMIALMVVAFYFLILRPQKKRQQAIQQTLNSLTPGSRVLLGSGIFGTIITVGDRQALLEISPGVELTVLKQAIIRTATEADEDTVDDSYDDAVEDDDIAAPGQSSVIDPTPDRPTPSAGADSTRLS